jgi:hypothetical protein
MPEPTATQTITVTKRKDKEKEKEITRKEEKDGIEKNVLEPMQPNPSARPGDEADMGLPGGTQQAFIGSGERPDVGAHLRGGGPGA